MDMNIIGILMHMNMIEILMNINMWMEMNMNEYVYACMYIWHKYEMVHKCI